MANTGNKQLKLNNTLTKSMIHLTYKVVKLQSLELMNFWKIVKNDISLGVTELFYSPLNCMRITSLRLQFS